MAEGGKDQQCAYKSIHVWPSLFKKTQVHMCDSNERVETIRFNDGCPFQAQFKIQASMPRSTVFMSVKKELFSKAMIKSFLDTGVLSFHSFSPCTADS
jgi:hypothetical protein